MVHAYSKIFGTQKPVFDGRTNLFVRDPLPIGKFHFIYEFESKFITIYVLDFFPEFVNEMEGKQSPISYD